MHQWSDSEPSKQSKCRAKQSKARQGKARQGKARQGKARQGKARQGKARQGKARQGKARQGKARQGKARQGKARQGKARQGKARQGQGKARQGKARQGKARQGKARQGKARQGKARQGKARQGKARQGKARQGKARQGKARQGKARQGNISSQNDNDLNLNLQKSNMFFEIVISLVFIWFVWSITTYIGKRKLPPGPFPLPFIGNTLEMLKDPHDPFGKLAKRYGDILTFYQPAGRVVVLNNATLIREAKLGRKDDMAGRSPEFMYPFGEIFGFNDVSISDYSPKYIFRRKVFKSAMHVFGSGVDKTVERAR